MLKKLDKLLLKTFIGPFIATFFIVLFILTMQYFWLYIDDLVGKGLDIQDILQLIGYVVLVWIPTALPLSILISTIMAFGNLGETFELVAIKSAGISLLRIFLPISVFAFILSLLSFLFSNNIIPVVQLKLSNLQYDIIVAKPALDIKEGTFYDKIDGYILKIGKKQHDSIIKNIIIFEKNNVLQDNFIFADSGLMRVSNNKQYIEFNLYNGWRFQERGPGATIETDYIRLQFKEFTKLFSISNFQLDKNKEKKFYDPKLLSFRQLNIAIDSLHLSDSIYYLNMHNVFAYNFNFFNNRNKIWKEDTFSKTAISKINQIIPDSLSQTIKNSVYLKIQNIKNANISDEAIHNDRLRFLQYHKIELNRKFTLSIACLILFLIGAPLGSIIKKGGFGTPFVIAVIFFISYHLMINTGEKIARTSTKNVFFLMWYANFIMFTIACILIYKSLTDAALLNFDKIYKFINLFKKISRPLLLKLKKNKNEQK